MSDAALDNQKPTLLAGPESGAGPDAPMIVQVAREFGVSPLRQLRESLSLRFGKSRLSSQEYYALRLFDPELSAEEKRAFVGVGANKVLNKALTPPVLAPTRAFVGNKLLYTLLLESVGIGTSRTQAVVSRFRDAGKVPMLRDAAAIVAFLRDQAEYPVFGKPLHGSQSTGSVRIEALEGDTLRLANGRTQGLEAFASEVMERYSAGFLLQTALDPHPEMAAVTGPALGSVRVLTVNDGTGPKPVYSVWKLPAPGAMSDNFWQSGSLLALLDLETGEAKTLVRGAGLKAESLTHHPTSGAPVVGMRLPLWQQIIDIAVEAHAVFPEFGVCGYDIAVTPDGPKILECNDGPAHVLYQYAAGRGIRNPEFEPIWQAVIARQAKQLARYKASLKKKEG